MNNIAPFTQTLVGSNGKNITLSDQLELLPNGKNHKFKNMKSSADYYVKVKRNGMALAFANISWHSVHQAKSISCAGASGKCAPIKCAPVPPATPPPPSSTPATPPPPYIPVVYQGQPCICKLVSQHFTNSHIDPSSFTCIPRLPS